MVLLTLTAALCIIWTGQAAAQCSNGWVFSKGSCYQIFKQQEPWLDASDYCELFGGYLVEFESQDEIDFASREVKSRHLGRNGVWIGLSDIVEENIWKWTTAKSIANISQTNWAPGQPNNRHANNQPNGENCVCILTDGKWYDEDCNNTNFYMCEKSAADPVIG